MLRNKYRPKRWNEIIGNETVVNALQNTLGDIQSYLIFGKKGCGKTTLARMICRYLLIRKLDIFEFNGSKNTSVNDARDLENSAFLMPSLGKRKAYIIDECHRLSPNAQDSLLKIFEEPPDHVFFIFCTTMPNKVVGTIDSRSHKYKVTPLKKDQIYTLLKRVKRKENLSTDKSVLRAIAKYCEGIPRDALTALQVVKGLSTKEAIKMIKEGTEEDIQINELSNSLLKNEPWDVIKDILKELYDKEENSETIRRAVLGYMNKVLLNPKSNYGENRATTIIEYFLDSTYDSGFASIVYACKMISK